MCLFDLSKDPCESKDISANNPNVVNDLLLAIVQYKSNMMPQMLPEVDPRGLPELYNYTWSHWLDQNPTTPQHSSQIGFNSQYFDYMESFENF